jgi:hypothetical protein
MSHASWLSSIFDQSLNKKVVKQTVERINKDKDRLNLDCIVVTGVSGCTMGGIISFETGIPLAVVRQFTGEHSSYMVEYPDGLTQFNYCIVDDLIGSGSTINRINNQVLKHVRIWDNNGKPIKPSLKKIYLYHSGKMSKFRLTPEEGRSKNVSIWSIYLEQVNEISLSCGNILRLCSTLVLLTSIKKRV